MSQNWLTQHAIQLCVVIVLLTLASHTRYSQASFEHTCTSIDAPRRGVCGPDLVELISTLCRNYAIFSGGRQRRSADKLSLDSRLKRVLLNKKDAFSYLDKRDYGSSGITCECCYNQCSIREMISYC